MALSIAPAAASEGPDWDELAECESSGNWSINTGNNYYGGIQFSDSTWRAYGGTAYAPTADRATKAQQIAVGRKVLASQGPGAWPTCSAKTGWESGGSGQAVRSDSSTVQRDTSPARSEVRQRAESPDPAPQVQRVTVPAESVATLTTAPRTLPPGGMWWTVTRGDTLTSIAAKLKRAGVDWQSIRNANRDVVEHPDWIFPGERLVIPAPTR